MYKLEQIREKLLEKNYFIDINTIKEFLKTWKIEAIYEDEGGTEFFDDMALEKIFTGMELKAKGENDKQIADRLSISPKVEDEILPQKVEAQPIEEDKDYEGAELTKISLDITNKTLSFLAETIAQKITSDVTAHITGSNLLQDFQQVEALQKDNELMAVQIKELVEENKKLINKISSLTLEKDKYRNIFGKFYMKE